MLQTLGRKFRLVSDVEIVHSDLKRKIGPFQVVATDLLYLDGKDLRNRPLAIRKEILTENLSNFDLLGFNLNLYANKNYEHIIKVAKDKGFPGVVFKRLRSTYVSGLNRDWRQMNF